MTGSAKQSIWLWPIASIIRVSGILDRPPSRAMMVSAVIASEAKQSILQRKERVDCFAALAMTLIESRIPLRSRDAERPRRCYYLRAQRAWGTPGARCTRGLVCTCSGRKHTSNNEHTGITRRSRTQWFYDLFRALPGDRALLPPSVGASGPHDFAVRCNISRPRAVDRSRIQRTRPAIPSHAKRCRVHRIPCPTSVTIAKRPSVWDGMQKVLDVIWGVRKQKYFCKGGWTQNCPTGKSRRLLHQ